MMQPMTPGAATAANLHSRDGEVTRIRHENERFRNALSAAASALHVTLHGCEESPDVLAGCEAALVHADNVLGKDHCTCQPGL